MQQGSSKLRSYGQWLDCSNFKWNFNKNQFSSIHFFKKLAPNVGLEPTTLRLRVSCSTDWASRAWCKETASPTGVCPVGVVKGTWRQNSKILYKGNGKKFLHAQSVGFEPTLPEGIWFLVRRLNHSATTACSILRVDVRNVTYPQEKLSSFLLYMPYWCLT